MPAGQAARAAHSVTDMRSLRAQGVATENRKADSVDQGLTERSLETFGIIDLLKEVFYNNTWRLNLES